MLSKKHSSVQASLDLPDPACAMRLDKWLWCARFYKTRSLAAEEISKGRVLINNAPAKPAREVRQGDTIHIRQSTVHRTVVVRGMNPTRGPAPVAQRMYAETEESVETRMKQAELRKLAPEPAFDLQHGRPTKRDRRSLEQLRNAKGSQLDERWSASLHTPRD